MVNFPLPLAFISHHSEPSVFSARICGARKRNARAIFWLNLLLGWTVAGWIVALILALMKDALPNEVIENHAVAEWVRCSGCGSYRLRALNSVVRAALRFRHDVRVRVIPPPRFRTYVRLHSTFQNANTCTAHRLDRHFQRHVAADKFIIAVLKRVVPEKRPVLKGSIEQVYMKEFRLNSCSAAADVTSKYS